MDRAHYSALVVGKKVRHSFVLNMQARALQYLEVSGLPPSASMFTLAVNSVSAKPVVGADPSSILVPLLVGLGGSEANDGGSLHTSVELGFMSDRDALGAAGSFALSPPRLKLPVSVLTVDARLPKAYDYAFSGDFGNTSVAQLDHPLPRRFSHFKERKVVSSDYEFREGRDYDIAQGRRDSAAIHVEVPKLGSRSYLFQRLLVVDEQLDLAVAYTPRQARKRTLGAVPWWRAASEYVWDVLKL